MKRVINYWKQLRALEADVTEDIKRSMRFLGNVSIDDDVTDFFSYPKVVNVELEEITIDGECKGGVYCGRPIDSLLQNSIVTIDEMIVLQRDLVEAVEAKRIQKPSLRIQIGFEEVIDIDRDTKVFSTKVDGKVINNKLICQLVRVWNAGENVDELLLNSEKCTQEEREYIMDKLAKYLEPFKSPSGV